MRISDWCSDVCSSELPRLAEFIARDAQQIKDLDEESQTRDDGTGNIAMNTARFIVEATKAFPKDGIMIRDGGATVIYTWTYNQAKPHDEIGSASCRERVCQYV